MSRIIAELSVQADTRELERAAKLFDEFSDAVKKGGKDAGKAYEDSLGAIDKLILKSNQLKKAQLDEKDIDEAKKYTKAIVEIDKQIAKVTGKLVQQKTATNELARGERAQAGILAQLLDREARLVRLRQQANNPTRLAAFNRELGNTRKKIDDINKASRPQNGGDNGTAALLGSLGGGVQGVFGGVGGAAAGPIGAAIGQQVGQAADAAARFSVESFKVAANYESILSSVRLFAKEDSSALIKDIENFAKENPIASLEKSMQAVSDLMGQGLNASEASQAIKGLTDIAGGNVERFERLSYQLAQIKTRGKLTGDNLKDLAQSGFNPLEEIARKTGESMAQVSERMSKGGVVFEEVLGAINDATTGMGRFAGRSEAVSKTAAGALANLEDATTTFKIALGNFMAEGGGSDFVLGLVEITRSATDMVNSLRKAPEAVGVLTSSMAESIPVFGGFIAAYKLVAMVGKDAREGTNETANVFEQAAARIKASVGTSFTEGLAAPLLDVKKTLEDRKREISMLLTKMEEEELAGAEKSKLQRLILEKKKYGDLSNEEQKFLKKQAKEQAAANTEMVKETKETTEQLTKAYTDRQMRLSALNDKIALSRFPVAETAQSIKDKYKIELDAEIREIEANQKAIDAEIIPKTQAQANLKIKLLKSYEEEAKLVRDYYFELESKDLEKHNQEIASIKAGFDADLLRLSRENQDGLLNTIRATFENEMEILRLRGIAENEQINESYDAQKKAIEASVLLAEDKSYLITKLDFERNAALLNADRMQAEKSLEISDRYFETYLSDLEAFNNAQLTKQDNADRIARISLQDALNKGLISRKEYYKKLDQLEKEAILRQKQNRIAQIVGEVAVINEQQAPVTTKSGTRKQISDAESKALDERKKALLEELKSLGIDIDEIVVGMGTKAQDKQKEQLQSALDFSVQMVQIGADAMRSITDAQLASIDNLISVQQSRLDNARALAEAGFTDSLQKEQDRIEILQQKREAIIRRQIILDNIARISSQTLAVANTIAGASTPPTPATPFIIAASVASVLATIGASIAQARSFNTGTAWLTPQNSSQGRRVDDIPAYLNKGEGIIPTAPNERFNPITQAMIANDPKKIAFAAMQHPEIKKHLFNDYSFALSKANSAGNSTVKEIDRLNKVIDRMEQAIGGITIVNNNAQLNFDADGASKYMTKRQQKLADIRNKTK